MTTPFADAHSKESARVSNEFYLAYGNAMVNWASIEQRMLWWFKTITALPDDMAQAIFYSAQNFSGRFDLLRAAISTGTMPDNVRNFLEAAAKKIKSYNNEYRNRLVHGAPVIEATDPTNHIFLWTQGKHGPLGSPTTTITTEKLSQMAANFGELTAILQAAWSQEQIRRAGGLPLVPPEVHLEQIEMLPNLPDCATPTRKQVGKQRQRRSSRASPRKKDRPA